ncbi:hypothetical protein [Clostridium tarantellae]|uniref:DUF4476 domain-containing protein n=1 Tax=Clostridium tarantellae TaxID=39493 RepID=A0A6I1MHB0_9CLOT|nr:hypothetical protein [Clostridium tarantellae]MPQ42550.1 hypothetical protein [Clostridium tarantellae]
MKKRDLSKFIIVITIITIVILLYIRYFLVNNYINGFKGIEPKNNKEKVQNIDSFEINEECIVYENNINEYKEKFSDNNMDVNYVENIECNDKKKLEYNNNSISNNKENINDKKKVKESYNFEKEESVQVFKMDKNKLINEISFKDKLTVLSIIKNLSSNEYKELLNNIKRNDELDAAVDIFTILKNNLSVKDYEELKEIAEPYLNIEIIEKKIKCKS